MYVYWWHVAGLRAVKVGHADDPGQHVRDYRMAYGLGGRNVRSYELDDDTDAGWVEDQLCRVLEARGLHRFVLPLGQAEEAFFALESGSFEDVHALLHDAARHISLAEISNRRKQQIRHALQPAQEGAPDGRERQAEPADEESDPPPRPAAAPPPASVASRPWRYLIGAIAVAGLVAGSMRDDPAPERAAAIAAEQESPRIARPAEGVPPGGTPAAGLVDDEPCSLVALGDTRVHVRCAASWASMRWDGRWVLDAGQDESDAVAFFKASDAARRVVAPPPRVAVPELPRQAEVEAQPASPSDPQAAPPPPRPRPAASRPAPGQTAPPPKETQLPRERCTVSRPKPGFRVYLVTCPDSQATIGRTVDSPTGWTVSESVNGTEAVEFFMKSPFAR